MKKKVTNKHIKIRLLIILVILIMIIKVIPIIILSSVSNYSPLQKTSQKSYPIKYNIADLIEYFSKQNEEQKVIFQSNSKLKYIIDEEKVEVSVSIKDYNENNEYTIIYGVENNLIEENIKDKKNIEITLDKEGKNECYITVKENGNIIKGGEWKEVFYYIKSYKEQFLDELANKGICTHYQNGTWESYDKSSKLLKSLGVKYVRTDFGQNAIQKDDETYDFSKYDTWIKDLTSTSKIEPIILLNGVNAGNDYLINSQEEIEKFCNFTKAVQNHYPKFQNIEVLNEVNYASSNNGAYLNQKDMEWYSRLLNQVYKNNKFCKFMTAGTASTPSDQKKIITSTNFIKYIFNTNGLNNINSIAYHPYSRKSNWFYSMIKEHKDYSNSIGGFNNLNVTEYGYSSSYCNDEEEQGEIILKMTASLEEDSNLIVLYNLWTVTSDPDSLEKYGLLNVDYTPKKSYYIMKNYYEKTNGGEYIGNFKMSNDITCHVYDKDGKIMMLIWTNDENKSDEACWSDNKNEKVIDYKDFIAYDMYGNKIANVNGKLTVSATPIYLENINTNYYFKAIENLVASKYNKFLNNYDSILNDEIKNEIESNKKFLVSISNKENIDVNEAISEMKKHFEIGDKLIDMCHEDKLNISFVQLSSMLDLLNDIGNSYEDLVTISTKVKDANIIQTAQKIQEVENLLYTNEDLDIIYPNKILKFSKDLYDKAKYINELQEENPIKNGLITSKNIHSELLTNWAKKFIDIYIDKYIKENPVTLEYSETNYTNNNVKVMLITDAEIQVTNNYSNINNREYIFEENGEFEFKYIIRGRKLSIKASVNYIDKVLPKIIGVTEGKIYSTAVTPIVQDTNLDKVELKVNGVVDPDYVRNTEIRSEGIYQLIAIDKANNSTIVNFSIIENSETSYKIKDNIITNIQGSTSLEQFKKNLKISIKYKVKHNGKEMNASEKISTGDILETLAGEQYILIVAGDLDKNGKVTINDVVKLRKYLLGNNNLDQIQKYAADANVDNKKLNIKDLVRTKIYALERKED